MYPIQATAPSEEVNVFLNTVFELIILVGVGGFLLVSAGVVLFKFLGIYSATGFGGAEPMSGREQFETGFLNSAKVRLSNADLPLYESDVPVEEVTHKDTSSPPVPRLDDRTSTIVLGGTGAGKSSFVKSRVENWKYDGALIAHSLAEQRQRNEYIEFFEQQDRAVIVLSSRGSDVRWDPFLDYDESVNQMESIAEGMFGAKKTANTGWTEPAKTLLVAALIVTSAEHDDIAKLPDVLAEGPDAIIHKVSRVDEAKIIHRNLVAIDSRDLRSVESTLLAEVRELLQSEMFDKDLPRLSLHSYLTNPDGRVLVINNVEGDRFADPFWRFFLESAIEITMGTNGSQQFLLDEFDKLPEIRNADTLVSAGRSADATAMLVSQDATQIKNVYGELTRSLYTQCPNRVVFRSGKTNTELALSTIGEYEVEQQTVNRPRKGGEKTSVTELKQAVKPLTTGQIESLDTGSAVIHSKADWWVCKLSEYTPDHEDGEND